jgi:hypothetical protein
MSTANDADLELPADLIEHLAEQWAAILFAEFEAQERAGPAAEPTVGSEEAA